MERGGIGRHNCKCLTPESKVTASCEWTCFMHIIFVCTNIAMVYKQYSERQFLFPDSGNNKIVCPFNSRFKKPHLEKWMSQLYEKSSGPSWVNFSQKQNFWLCVASLWLDHSKLANKDSGDGNVTMHVLGSGGVLYYYHWDQTGREIKSRMVPEAMVFHDLNLQWQFISKNPSL